MTEGKNHPIISAVTAGEFLRRIQEIGRERGVEVAFDTKRGKGSHGYLYYGEKRTTLKDRKKEVGDGLFLKMLKDLGLTKADL